VVVADDHEFVRAAIVAQLEGAGWMRCVGEAGSGAGAIELVERLRPPIALVDVGLPDTSGFEVARAVARGDAATRVILVSARISVELVERGFDAGAWGYLSKVSSVDLLDDAVRAVLDGVRFVDPEARTRIAPSIAGVLDDTELRVLEHMVTGHADEAIATRLRITVDEVAVVVGSMLAKLDCASRSAAIDRAIRQGLAE
jgi:DNA-binding NarL/FixJ family response regulator